MLILSFARCLFSTFIQIHWLYKMLTPCPSLASNTTIRYRLPKSSLQDFDSSRQATNSIFIPLSMRCPTIRVVPLQLYLFLKRLPCLYFSYITAVYLQRVHHAFALAIIQVYLFLKSSSYLCIIAAHLSELYFCFS